MLKFVQSLFGPKPNPIGVDFGSESLRMAQVQLVDGEYRLLAAATELIPVGIRKDFNSRVDFLAEACRNLLSKGGFTGRQCVIGMPASLMHVQHLRLPKMDDDALRKALPWEVRGKIPIEPSKALLRHVVAGEVFQDQEARLEVIVMAVQRETVNKFIKVAERAKLEVVGLQPEPKALLDCFKGSGKGRKGETEPTTLFIDIGYSGTRAIVVAADQIVFARFIPIGGDQFNYAASVALKVPVHEARHRRIQQAGVSESELAGVSVATVDPILDPMTAKRLAERGVIEDACRDPLDRLITELELCRRYYEATFPNRPIDRIVFVGGESMQRLLCQQIARRLGIAAQLGDPMVRLGRTQLKSDGGLDVTQPQPGWVVSVGLSMGQPLV
jgi:type IV pilus assembly protein PilM